MIYNVSTLINVLNVLSIFQRMHATWTLKENFTLKIKSFPRMLESFN
jgi:hypothetical protein